MEQDETFRIFHRYNKLVRRQLVQPLQCSCGQSLITGFDKNDDLILKCLSCGSNKSPGLGTVEKVRAVVKEHFLED